MKHSTFTSGVLIWMILTLVGGGWAWIAIVHADDQQRYSINTSVCGFRLLVKPTLDTYRAAAKDPTLTPSQRKRNDTRIRQTEAFLATQVTAPSDFDCTRLNRTP